MRCWAFPAISSAARSRASAAEIGVFCQRNFGVSFPVFAKIEVNGARRASALRFLRRREARAVWAGWAREHPLEFHQVSGRPRGSPRGAVRAVTESESAGPGHRTAARRLDGCAACAVVSETRFIYARTPCYYRFVADAGISFGKGPQIALSRPSIRIFSPSQPFIYQARGLFCRSLLWTRPLLQLLWIFEPRCRIAQDRFVLRPGSR